MHLRPYHAVSAALAGHPSKTHADLDFSSQEMLCQYRSLLYDSLWNSQIDNEWLYYTG